MPTPAERRALLFVATVAALGTGVRAMRAVRVPEPPPEDRAALAVQIARVDSAIASGGRRASKAPSREPAAPATAPATATVARRGDASRAPRPDPLDALRHSPIDLDRADSAALDLLPGIGPALAARIVADRDERGAFGSLDALQRVRGVGPALAARLAPFVTFSSAGRQFPMGPPAHEGRAHP